MTQETLTSFLAWFTLLNYSVLLIAWGCLVFVREPIMAIHAHATGVSKDELPRLYFQFFSVYKVLIMTFGLIPYLVLRLIMA